MNDLMLVRPSREKAKEICGYCEEHYKNGEEHINGSGCIERFSGVEEWIDSVLAGESGPVAEGMVNATTFLSVRKSDGRIIGTIQLRHYLNAELAEHAGHIGYSVRPSERRKGYGRSQLLLVLDEARKLGLPRVMLSCDRENTASKRTILSCGGRFEREGTDEGKPILVYWITL